MSAAELYDCDICADPTGHLHDIAHSLDRIDESASCVVNLLNDIAVSLREVAGRPAEL